MFEKLVYRPAEVQAALGIRNTKFWALVKAGSLDTRKIGSATVVPAESLQAFVDGLPKAGIGKSRKSSAPRAGADQAVSAAT